MTTTLAMARLRGRRSMTRLIVLCVVSAVAFVAGQAAAAYRAPHAPPPSVTAQQVRLPVATAQGSSLVATHLVAYVTQAAKANPQVGKGHENRQHEHKKAAGDSSSPSGLDIAAPAPTVADG